MVSKARKNRPKKKEIPQDKWDFDLQNLRSQFEYGGKKREQNKNSEEER
jgi:hypothetical protein